MRLNKYVTKRARSLSIKNKMELDHQGLNPFICLETKELTNNFAWNTKTRILCHVHYWPDEEQAIYNSSKPFSLSIA